MTKRLQGMAFVQWGARHLGAFSLLWLSAFSVAWFLALGPGKDTPLELLVLAVSIAFLCLWFPTMAVAKNRAEGSQVR